MLALYHLFSGVRPASLPGIESLLTDSGATELPSVRRVVLVGNKISPGNPVTKEDGTVVRTLWGEIAWQLGGSEAYARIAADDERASNPGDRLRELFNDYGPCLILIDEWVAYARQLHDDADLPGGDFETHFTFAQALTEAARSSDNCLLLISLPASDGASSPQSQADDVEVGGIRGRDALERLRKCDWPGGVVLAACDGRGRFRDRSSSAVRADRRSRGAHRHAMSRREHSRSCTTRTETSSRWSAARPTTNGASRLPIRFTLRSSTVCMRTGRRWSTSSEREASSV